MSTTMTRATRHDSRGPTTGTVPPVRPTTARHATAQPTARPTAHTTAEYCPFPINGDPRAFGLTTSAMRLTGGVVVVRHGRRTLGDTATILLHGAAGSWTTWSPMLAAAAADSSPSTPFETDAALPLTDLIIPDLPGWGESTLPAAGSDRSVEALAATVAQVARALGYRRWIVVGHSMGGFIALQLAASEPDATVSVGLVSPTTFSVIDSVRHPFTRFSTLPAFTALLMVMRLLAVLGRAGRPLLAALRNLSLLRLAVSPLFSRPAKVDATVIAALGAEVRPEGFTVASAQAGAYDAEGAWSRIECPVRSLTGDSDVFVAATDVDRLRGIIRRFESMTVTGAGHFAHIERPRASLNALSA